MKMSFYECKHCGNIIAYIKDKGVPILCCGENMVEIIPGAVDAAKEKHLPSVKIEGREIYVTVGEVVHPMEDAHYIEWIAVETESGNQRKSLKPGDEPKAYFCIHEDDKVVAVYAYCNLHGLWKV